MDQGAVIQGWKTAAIGYTVSLAASFLSGVMPSMPFWNALSYFGLVYFLYGLWRVGRASRRMEVFSLNLWATLIQYASMVLFGLAFRPVWERPEALFETLNAGMLLYGFLAYAGFVYGSYLEMKGMAALAEVGRVPLLEKAARWIFWGALLLPLVIGLFVLAGAYLVIAVALWQGPKLEADAGSEV